MTKLSATSDHHLVIHSGPGLENCASEEGTFEVRSVAGIQQFNKLIGAILYYYKLEEQASIWDVTTRQELIESKIIIQLDRHSVRPARY